MPARHRGLDVPPVPPFCIRHSPIFVTKIWARGPAAASRLLLPAQAQSSNLSIATQPFFTTSYLQFKNRFNFGEWTMGWVADRFTFRKWTPIVLLAQFKLLIRSPTVQHCDEYAAPLIFFCFFFGNGKSHELKTRMKEKKTIYTHHGLWYWFVLFTANGHPFTITLCETRQTLWAQTHTYNAQNWNLRGFVCLDRLYVSYGPILNIPSPLSFN